MGITLSGYPSIISILWFKWLFIPTCIIFCDLYDRSCRPVLYFVIYMTVHSDLFYILWFIWLFMPTCFIFCDLYDCSCRPVLYFVIYMTVHADLFYILWFIWLFMPTYFIFCDLYDCSCRPVLYLLLICCNSVIIIYHDFLPTPRMGSHVKSDKTHTQSSRYTP